METKYESTLEDARVERFVFAPIQLSVDGGNHGGARPTVFRSIVVDEFDPCASTLLAFTICEMVFDVLGAKKRLPMNFASIKWVPKERFEVVKKALLRILSATE